MNTILPEAKIINSNYGLFVIEPTNLFLEWAKSAAAEYGINPSEIISQITTNHLMNHSLVVIADPFLSVEQVDLFIKNHRDVIFKTMFESWIFPEKNWPKERSEDIFEQLFSVSYFPYLIDLFQTQTHSGPNDIMSIILAKPKTPTIEWFNQLYAEKRIDILNTAVLKSDVFKKTGTFFTLAPMLNEPQERENYIKKNYSILWDFLMSRYCTDPSLWIKDKSFETFLSCFDCQNYSPVLSSKVWTH